MGYSDHIDAENKFSTILPLLTIPLGVTYIEKHITFDRMLKGVDYYSSFEPKELKQFVEDVRLVEKSIGSLDFQFSKAEINYRNTVKKSWTITENLKKK